MKIVQLSKKRGGNFNYIGENIELINPLVLVFGDRYLLENNRVYRDIKELFPDGDIVFGSSCGDITSNSIHENEITITAIELERSQFAIEAINLSETKLDSYKAGLELGNKISKDNLKYIFVLSDGSFINGSELAKGLSVSIPNNVLITGALCGDSDRFEKTLVSYNENPKPGEIVIVGFYGDYIEANFATNTGWLPFGPERKVTNSTGNILYEVDKEPVLNLYKSYLGEKAEKMPNSALLYPLSVKPENEEQEYIRTVLNVNIDHNVMVFAGDVPNKSKIKLMITSPDKLIEASRLSAQEAMNLTVKKPQLAIFASASGRKLVLDQLALEEIEVAKNVLGKDITICGFYSLGEISPFNGENMCKMHNQSMTITLLSE